jgi:hypothetical protein
VIGEARAYPLRRGGGTDSARISQTVTVAARFGRVTGPPDPPPAGRKECQRWLNTASPVRPERPNVASHRWIPRCSGKSPARAAEACHPKSAVFRKTAPWRPRPAERAARPVMADDARRQRAGGVSPVRNPALQAPRVPREPARRAGSSLGGAQAVEACPAPHKLGSDPNLMSLIYAGLATMGNQGPRWTGNWGLTPIKGNELTDRLVG